MGRKFGGEELCYPLEARVGRGKKTVAVFCYRAGELGMSFGCWTKRSGGTDVKFTTLNIY